MLTQIKHTATKAARKAGLMTGGLLCVVIGLGFLTVAAWLYLAAAIDRPSAAMIIGAIYAGLGLLLVGFASLKSPTSSESKSRFDPLRDAESQAKPATNSSPLMQAFLFGLQAGTSASSASRHRE